MPKESQPVICRTSASANGWWAKMADKEVNESFRVLDGQTSSSSLFTDYELKDLPFRKQLRPPQCTLTFPAPSPPPLSSFNSSLPNMISSTEITRVVMAKEIKNMEDVQEQHLNDMAAMRKKVNGVFRVNRALAVFQAENF